jgi:hypothetical protein
MAEPLYKKQEYIGLITAKWSQVAKAAKIEDIIATGKLLKQAQIDWGYGEFERTVRKRLPFTARTARALIKIAHDEVLSDRKYIADLPQHWGTLERLTRLPTEAKLRYRAEGRIHAKMFQKDAERLVAEWKAEREKASERARRKADLTPEDFLFSDWEPGNDEEGRASKSTGKPADAAKDEVTDQPQRLLKAMAQQVMFMHRWFNDDEIEQLAPVLIEAMYDSKRLNLSWPSLKRLADWLPKLIEAMLSKRKQVETGLEIDVVEKRGRQRRNRRLGQLRSPYYGVPRGFMRDR